MSIWAWGENFGFLVEGQKKFDEFNTVGFQKPTPLKDSQMFGSLDSLSAKVPKGSRGKSNILQSSSSISTEVLKRAFSTEFQVASKTSKMSGVQEVEPPRTRQLAQTLNAEEMMKMDFYSKFTPTSVTLSHFLDHSSGGGTVEDSFLFLRREIPVRLANIMMELEVNI